MDNIYTLGIDIGSTASKCVILRDGKEIVSKSLISVGAGTSGPPPTPQDVSSAMLPLNSTKAVRSASK